MRGISVRSEDSAHNGVGRAFESHPRTPYHPSMRVVIEEDTSRTVSEWYALRCRSKFVNSLSLNLAKIYTGSRLSFRDKANSSSYSQTLRRVAVVASQSHKLKVVCSSHTARN